MNTNITPTPETDDNDTQAELAAWELLAEARRERDELRRWTSINGVLELQRERDEALEKVENQRARIVYLEGAISHATGTPLTKAKDEIKQLNRSIQKMSELLATERAMADRLANTLSIALSASDDPNAAYAAWKEARK